MTPVHKERKSVGARRASYVGTIVVNVVLFWVVGWLLEWGWPGFLTDEFAGLVPWIRVSLAVGVVVAIACTFWDPRWFVAVGESLKAVVSVIVTLWILNVFPFDFTGYASWWEPVTRIALIVGIVAASIAVIVNLVLAIVYAIDESKDAPPDQDSSPSA